MLMVVYTTDVVEIIDPLEDLTASIEESKNVTFICTGVGHPPLLVQWSKVNGSLNDAALNTRMSMLTNEGNVARVTLDLLLTSVSREDTGIYVCSASNLLNNVTREVTLVIQCMYLIYSYESRAYCVKTLMYYVLVNYLIDRSMT